MSDARDALKKLSPEEFTLFRDWIHKQSGIFMEDSKADSLRLSLGERLADLDLVDYRDYFQYLSQHEDEFKELMSLVTINETSFFRFAAQFDALRDVVIPEILSNASGKSHFQVWSAGCSTGEEPYTIAMTLLDSELKRRNVISRVVGTDVSMRALLRARAGSYPLRSVSSMPQEQLGRWFESHGEKFRPAPSVRDICEFHYQNLCREPWAPEYRNGWDVIFCRNVTIYFQQETTRRIVDNFYEALNPGGYLFIGHSETLASISQRFEALEVGGVFLYRKPLNPGVAPITGFKQPGTKKAAEKPGVDRSAIAKLQEQAAARQKEAARKESRAARSKQPPAPAPEPPADEQATGVAGALKALEAAKPRDAIELAEAVLAQNPGDTEAQLVIAFAHADLGDLATAAQEANRILIAKPLSAPARYLLGVIHREQGDLDGAIAQFKRTIYVDHEFVLAHFALAAIYRQRGQLAEAAREYENTTRALYMKPEGSWTTFLGGFTVEMLVRTCERGFNECVKADATKANDRKRR